MSPTIQERLRLRAEHHGVALSGDQLDQLTAYFTLLERWNRRINLTALPLEGLPDPTADRLFFEPLVAATLVDNRDLGWFDFGSGGGSPAVPLKVLRPRTRLTMIESRSRKGAFLREVVRELSLETTAVLSVRLKDLATLNLKAAADLVTVRGVRMDAETVAIAHLVLKPEGRLFHFSGPLPAESVTSVIPQTPNFQQLDEVPLPSSGARLIVWARS